MEVRFTHPRTSDTYLAEISPLLTVKQALNALHSSETGPFLPPPQPGETYNLVLRRTNQRMTLDTTMGSAGVQNGDVLDILLGGQGAG